MPEADSRIRPDEVLAAYCRGIFPMADSREGEIRWYRPETRGIIPLDEFKLPHSDMRIIRRRKFQLRANHDFIGTIRACAGPRPTVVVNDDDDDVDDDDGEGEENDDSWISEEIIDLYVQLHEAGFAHSVEAYLEGELVGGLYGIAIHAAFFGESMFSRPGRGG